MSRVSWFLRPLRPRGLNSQGALWQILKRGSKIAKKTQKLHFSDIFFHAEKEFDLNFWIFFLTSHSKIHFFAISGVKMCFLAILSMLFSLG